MPDNFSDTNVFVNCPFDEDYEPILQSILFCLVYLGFQPRIASERLDGGENRLDKICELIEASKYSIHDLSRCQAEHAGEIFRLNMPLELGIDFGCRKYFGRGRESKKYLILEEQRYRFQAAISDISGCDIESHGGNFEKAVKAVRDWLVDEANAYEIGPARILGAYSDFQEWNYERLLNAGFSEENIQKLPTLELLEAMKRWTEEGRPRRPNNNNQL